MGVDDHRRHRGLKDYSSGKSCLLLFEFADEEIVRGQRRCIETPAALWQPNISIHIAVDGDHRDAFVSGTITRVHSDLIRTNR